MNQLKLKVTAGINSCAVNKTLQLLYNIQYDYERVNKEYELYNYIYNYVDYKWKRSFLKELREVCSLICLGSLSQSLAAEYWKVLWHVAVFALGKFSKVEPRKHLLCILLRLGKYATNFSGHCWFWPIFKINIKRRKSLRLYNNKRPNLFPIVWGHVLLFDLSMQCIVLYYPYWQYIDLFILKGIYFFQPKVVEKKLRTVISFAFFFREGQIILDFPGCTTISSSINHLSVPTGHRLHILSPRRYHCWRNGFLYRQRKANNLSFW